MGEEAGRCILLPVIHRYLFSTFTNRLFAKKYELTMIQWMVKSHYQVFVTIGSASRSSIGQKIKPNSLILKV